MNLPPWVSDWWSVANDRRQRLIVKKHTGSLTKRQEEELVLLQKVAEAILEYSNE